MNDSLLQLCHDQFCSVAAFPQAEEPFHLYSVYVVLVFFRVTFSIFGWMPQLWPRYSVVVVFSELAVFSCSIDLFYKHTFQGCARIVRNYIWIPGS